MNQLLAEHPEPPYPARVHRCAHLLLPAVLTALAGCGSDDQSTDIEQRREQWRALGIADYAYTVRESCQCVAAGEPVRLVISGGKLQSSSAGSGGSIDDLFGLMLQYARRDPDELSAGYDETFGYPTRFRVDPDTSTSDDEWAFVIECFDVDTAACPL